ncbi:MAG: hypothetical protein OES25_14025 [Acidobacteriota bacterium]|nr:hypothetical protein [Acidobacteriota bacterium]
MRTILKTPLTDPKHDCSGWLTRRKRGSLTLLWLVAALGTGCTTVDRSGIVGPPYVVSSSPIRIVSANDGDSNRQRGEELPDSITVIDLSPDAPPLTRTVSGTVPNTFAGAPFSAIVLDGKYAAITYHPWGQAENTRLPSQISLVDLDAPDLPVVATLPLPDHAWQVASHPDGETLIAISDHQIHLISVEAGGLEIVAQSEPFPLYFISFAISPDGHSIIVTAAEQIAYSAEVELHLFVLEGNTVRHALQIGVDPEVGEIDQPFAPRFSPDGSRALVLNGLGLAARPPLDAVLSIDMTLETPKVTEAIPSVAQGLESAAFHPSGDFAVITCIDGPYVGHLAVVDLTVSPMQLLYYLPMAFVPQGIEFSPDGEMLFVQANMAHHIDVYSVTGMKLVRSPYVLHTGEGPASIALSPLLETQ